jgi:hypothetical protein
LKTPQNCSRRQDKEKRRRDKHNAKNAVGLEFLRLHVEFAEWGKRKKANINSKKQQRNKFFVSYAYSSQSLQSIDILIASH